jgi:hypothetical protein
MRVRYFSDTDTALVEFTDNEVYEIKEISENVYVDLDRRGNLDQEQPNRRWNFWDLTRYRNVQRIIIHMDFEKRDLFKTPLMPVLML